ncbi:MULTISPECIES: hypothetical protein [Streptomyces]|uniref:hypothetical protein n=1 Tax=Streptomyces TaxID=1883 RepID=UPI0004BDED2D|nr:MULTISPECIES: hypothetical protein [Streptomyces]NNG88208.1 hypothetical protein [Streptomyces cacaoi]QHF95569.1 hypothetical protein DEH18_18865 [Streptomyces sp. NHF165]
MRWLTLYARSRQMPVSLAAVVISAVVGWALGRGGHDGPGDPQMAALALAAGTTAASTGLGGQDVALDRTAAIRWRPRRAVHVLLAGALVAAVATAVQTLGDDLGAPAFLLRDSAGLMGLAALGAVVCGAQFAWTLPIVWLAASLFAPPPESVPAQVLSWMLLPAGTPAGTWTALALTAAGTVAYAFAGPKR